MKMPVTFAVVLFLHVFVLSALLIQPGCKSKEETATADKADTMPPMSAGQQDSTQARMNRQRGEVDSAFNAGLEPSSKPLPLDGSLPEGVSKPAAKRMRATPTRPSWQYDPAAGTVVADGGNEASGVIEPIDPAGEGPALIEPLEPGTPAASGMQTYTVERGDTLWGISRRYDVSLNRLMEINGLTKESVLKPGQILSIPMEDEATATAPAVTATPRTEGMSAEIGSTLYTVRRGDTLSRIASQHGTTVSALKAVNNLSGDLIRVGQELVVPGNGAQVPAATTSTPRTTPTSAETPKGYYRVQSGDTLIKIARRHDVTVQQLMEWNGIQDPRLVRVGQELRVRAPGGTTQTAPRPSPRTEVVPASREAPVMRGGEADIDLENLEDIPETKMRGAE